LNVKGLVADINNPKIDITLASPYLDLHDMLLLNAAGIDPENEAITDQGQPEG